MPETANLKEIAVIPDESTPVYLQALAEGDTYTALLAALLNRDDEACEARTGSRESES